MKSKPTAKTDFSTGTQVADHASPDSVSRAEVELARVNRALRLVSDCNQVLVRATEENLLLGDVCRLIVEKGGYRFAWVGYAQRDSDKTVWPMASAGTEDGYLGTAKISWADTARGRGPTGTAIRTGKPDVARFIATDPVMQPWREEALKHAFQSSVALPLKSAAETFGSLTIYSERPDAFDEQELGLLTELADNLAFGIMALRDREARARADQLVRLANERLEQDVQERIAELEEVNTELEAQIRERMRAGEALRESENRYRSLFENMLDGFAYCKMLYDDDGTPVDFVYESVNKAFYALTGMHDVVGKKVSEVIPGIRESNPELLKTYSRVARGGHPEHLELDLQLLSMWLSIGVYCPEPGYFVAVFENITERKRLEEEKANLALFPAENPNPILRIGRDQRVLYANHTADLFLQDQGWRPGEAVPLALWRYMQPLFSGQYSSEFEVVDKDRRILSFICVSISDKGYVNLYGRDVTKRKRLEEALARHSEQLLQANSELEEANAQLSAELEVRTQIEEELRTTNEQLSEEIEERAQIEEELRSTNEHLVEEELKLRESEDRLSLALEVSLMGTWELDLTTHAAWRSPRHDQIFGYNKLLPEWTFDMFLEHVLPEDRPEVNSKFQNALSTGGDWDFECRIKRADRAIRWIWARGKSYCNDHGQPVRMIGLVQDITERKRNEEKLRESERLYRAIGETLDYGVWVCDQDGRNTYASESFLKMVGITQEQCSNFGWGELLHPDDAERTIAAWQDCVRTGGTWDIEHRFRGSDGHWHPVLARGVPIRDDQGQITAWVGINLDISKIKQAENALRITEERLRTGLEATNIGMWEWDVPNNIATFTPTWYTLLGYEPHELPETTETWEKLLHPDDVAPTYEQVNRTWRGEVEFYETEVRMKAKSGEWRWILSRGKVVTRASDGSPLRMIGTHTDITSLKEMEQALRDSEDRYRNLVETAPIPMIMASKNRIVLSNQAFFNLIGTDHVSEDMDLEMSRFLHPRDLARVEGVKRNVLETRSKTGVIEFRMKRPDGSHRHVEAMAQPVDRKGENSTLIVFRDVTSQKHADELIHKHAEDLELQVAERTAQIQRLERLRQESEKQVAIGRMAARIAHEINNPLAGIKNSFLLVKKAIPVDFKHYEFVELIEKELDRIARIVRQMFEVYKPERSDPAMVKVPEVLSDVAALLEGNARSSGVTLHVDASAASEPALLHEDSLKQALFSLIQNAVEASHNGGMVRIVASEKDHVLAISVVDQGCGIPTENGSRIFEPFFTTKSDLAAGGLGLGLSVTKGVVEAMGGVLSYESKVGEGTTFQMIIPIDNIGKEQ